MFNCIEGVENKIFHGINLKYYSNKLEDLKIFEEIIKSRKIMSRNMNILNVYQEFMNKVKMKFVSQCILKIKILVRFIVMMIHHLRFMST